MTDLKIPFGLLGDKLVSPSEVTNGLKCNCVCPGCKKPLIANHPKSENRVKYFSHYVKNNCSNGYESALHLAAKRVLIEEKRILVPAIYAVVDVYDKNTHIHETASGSFESKVIILGDVEQEVRDYDGVIPDIVATSNSKTIFIEIAVTHFIDDEKLAKLKKLQIPTIEIYLEPTSQVPTLEEIRELVVNTPHNRDWVVNPKLDKLKERVKIEAEKKLGIAVNYEMAKQLKFQQAHEKYLRLSDEDKLIYELKKLNKKRTEIESIIRENIKGGKSFGVSNHVWQLSIYRRFIHRKQGNLVEKDDVLEWLNKRFEIKPIFKDSPQIAIYYYLRFLNDLKMLEYNKYTGGYFVESDTTGNDFPY